jgi:Glycosyltransferase family 87
MQLMLRIYAPDPPRSRFPAAWSRFRGGWPRALAGRAQRVPDSLDRLITARRVRGYSTICLAVWLASLTASVLLGRPPRNALDKVILPDYLAHWTGGRLVLEGAGERLYDIPTQLALQIQAVGENETFAWYVNPPYIALFYLPFAALPYPPSALAWTLFAVILLLLSMRLLRPLVPDLGEACWGTVLLAAAAAAPVYELIGSGQDSALSLFLWLAGIRLALARRDCLAGLTFALGLYKPQLFLLPPLLFLCWWRWRALLGWALTAGLLATVSLLLVGPEGVHSWLALPLSPAYRESIQAGQAWKMQAVSALLTASAPTHLASAAEAAGLLLGLALVVGFLRLAGLRGRPGGSGEAPLWGSPA